MHIYKEYILKIYWNSPVPVLLFNEILTYISICIWIYGNALKTYEILRISHIGGFFLHTGGTLPECT